MKSFLKRIFKDQGEDLSQKQIARLQYARLMGVGGVLLVFIVLALTFVGGNKTPEREPQKDKSTSKKVSLASDGVDVREIWATRVEEKAKEAQKEAADLKTKNNLLEKRLETIEDILKNATLGEEPLKKETLLSSSKADQPNIQRALSGQSIGGFPKASLQDSQPLERNHSIEASSYSSEEPLPAKRKIRHGSLKSKSKPLHHADWYVPAGSYAKAVLTSGVVVSTATSTQSNPQPIMVRLADDGNLPRGFKSHIKDAVLIGSCYGDLSAERAMCRLHTLSYIENEGETVERIVEGWIIGEDGAPGLRGHVVDRSGDVVRESFIAGILSGMSNFLQFDASRSVYPVTPFGQTNAMNPKDALQGGLGKGASNALEKLAEFSIKRAEAMQPVIVVNPGRVVDIVFKKGIDLRFDSSPSVKVVSTNQNTPNSKENF